MVRLIVAWAILVFVWFLWGFIIKYKGWTSRRQCLCHCLAFLLCIVTVCYGLAFYQSYENYQIWVQERLQQYPEYIRPWVDFTPFLDTKTAGYLMLAGFVLFFSWLLLFTYRNEPKPKPELTTLEACSPPSLKGRAEREQKRRGENKIESC